MGQKHNSSRKNHLGIGRLAGRFQRLSAIRPWRRGGSRCGSWCFLPSLCSFGLLSGIRPGEGTPNDQEVWSSCFIVATCHFLPVLGNIGGIRPRKRGEPTGGSRPRSDHRFGLSVPENPQGYKRISGQVNADIKGTHIFVQFRSKRWPHRFHLH